MAQENLNRTHVLIDDTKIEGNINKLKELAVELRELAKDAGRDLSHNLNDALFQIEVEYQAFHELDEDNFEVKH